MKKIHYIMLSYFTTLIFGTALGLSIVVIYDMIAYQREALVGAFVSIIIILVIIGILLRAYTLYINKKIDIFCCSGKDSEKK